MSDELSNDLIIETSAGAEPATRVGTSQWGAVYRSLRGPFAYRVLLHHEAGLDSMHRAKSWIDQPVRPGLAPIVEVDQSVGGGAGEVGFYFVKYAIGSGASLTSALSEGDLGKRLAAAALVCARLPTWWLNVGSGVMPMPADVVFDDSGGAVLLPFPFRPAPDPGAMYASPERVRYLSPERVRGIADLNGDNEDIFALGAILLECFYQPADLEPAEALTRAASRSLHLESSLRNRVPAWMDRLEAVGEARQAAWDLVQRKVTATMPLDLWDLAARLRHCAHLLQPLELVADLRSRGRPAEALDLVTEILREDDALPQACDLLLEAAGIASQLGRGIEALEMLERVIAAWPERETAYLRQLAEIGRLEQRGPLQWTETADAGDAAALDAPRSGGTARKLEAMVWRDFEHLPASLAADERAHCEGIVSRYLLHRRRWSEVRRFIDSRLWDGKTFLFWRFRHRLDDVEALLGLGAIADARRQLDDIARGLQHVARNKSVEASTIATAQRRVHELRVQVVASAPPGPAQ